MTDEAAKPDPRQQATAALAAVTSWGDQLHAMTSQAYAATRNSYGWSSLQAAIEIRVAAAKAARALNGGADAACIVDRIRQTADAIRAAGRRIKADMEFYDVRAMDEWPAVFERLDWQSLVLNRLAEGPLGDPPAHVPTATIPAREIPAPKQQEVDRYGQSSMF